VAHWARADVEALEKAPSSVGRRAVVAEVIDARPAEGQVSVRALAEQLIAALKQHAPVGLDLGRLEAMEVRFSSISATEGTGARIGEARVAGTFSTGPIRAGPEPGKS
jgi:hypothetical protein